MSDSTLKPPLSSSKVLFVTTLGNALEFFDFTVFTFFTFVIGKLFFPTASPLGQMMLSAGTFVVGYFFRPLGGILIGIYADRSGRKAAMTLTVGMMALSSAMIGLAPTYQSIGLWAPFLILLSRVMQGISAGGEVGASTALLIENAGPRRRGFFGSWQFASQSLGIAMGAGISVALTRTLSGDALTEWGWRIPFLLGTLIAPVGVYIRARLMETAKPGSVNSETQNGSLSELLRSHYRRVLLGILLTFGGTSANFIILFSLPNIATKALAIPSREALLGGVVTGLVGFFVSPLGGLCSDIFGRKPVIFCSRLAVVVVVIPLFIWLVTTPTVEALLIVEAVLAATAAFGGAVAIGFLSELFPRHLRATGMAIVYSFGVAFAGLVAQFVGTYLVTVSGSPMPAAWYVVLTLCVSTVALYWIPEPHPQSDPAGADVLGSSPLRRMASS